MKKNQKINQTGLAVLESRYLLRDSSGQINETIEGLFRRVSRFVALAEKRNRSQWEKQFFDIMMGLRFLPNTPTLMNAGRKRGQLSACFVLPIEDRLDSIFETLKNAALIHQSGGGTGFSFSRLRPHGTPVRSTSGVAAGPVSFLKIFDTATEVIKQGGVRRGANMGILRVDHPDLFEFIETKKSGQIAQNFNLSVAITDAFMQALKKDLTWNFVDPHSNQVKKTLPARDVFDRLTQAAWSTGDPGLVFIDRINFFNPTPREGEMESTNPCGEQPLLSFESCNLGSLNLLAYFKNNKFNWHLFKKDICLAVRFLDNVIDLNDYPLPEIKKITLKNRKIGLGVMGFADLLYQMQISYDSDAAKFFGEELMSFLERTARGASVLLAKQRKPFPSWKGSLWEKLGFPPLRNATVTTVAPTGTISLIAGVSSGIEPVFSAVLQRNILEGQSFQEIHPAVFAHLGNEAAQLSESEIALKMGPTWKTADSVSVEKHIEMQAVFQRFSDSAVSKTINLSSSATVDDVKKAYLLAFEEGCKGITVYRDQSKPTQVLVRSSVAPVSCVETSCDSC